MKLRMIDDSTATISGLSRTEVLVIFAVISALHQQCFGFRIPFDGHWYSGDEFVMRLNDQERKALTKIGNEIDRFCGI